MGLDANHDYFSNARLTGKGIVVLGAGGGGMGTETSIALAAAGAQLLCVDANADQAEEIASTVGGHAYQADVTDRPQVQAVFNKAHELFGVSFYGVVDIVGMARNGAMSGMTDEDLTWQFNIVFRHALLATQIAAPMLSSRGGGAIAFVGSLSGMAALPNQSLYGMCKAALHHLVRCAALEYGPQGVRVNAVAPGFVQTPRLKAALSDKIWNELASTNPLRRTAYPADIAKALLFLMSNMSDYVTGNILTLDGGASNNLTFPGLDVPLQQRKGP
jgi:NAD(P)-dependent dehydrogenase (short-subunit alcohol dehydrogenase family)